MEYFRHDFGEMSEEEREVLKGKLKEAISNCRGSAPGFAEDTLSILNKKRTTLKQELRKFTATQIALTKKPTKTKAHKRYGLPYNGTKLNRKLKLFIGIDTSGSVSDEQLKLIGSEVNALKNQGIDLIVLQSDYEAQDINKDYKASSSFKVKGRGGTSFEPYFEALKKHKDVDGVVIFSDMEVSVEEGVRRPRQKVLWVSTTDSKSPYDFGTNVCIKDFVEE
jgi:predicted metal-dependent peptidase